MQSTISEPHLYQTSGAAGEEVELSYPKDLGMFAIPSQPSKHRERDTSRAKIIKGTNSETDILEAG